MAPDRRSLGRGVKALVAVVGQQGQAHLLVQQLGAKAVDHTRGARHVRLAQRKGVVAPGEELAGQDPPVHEVDGLSPRVELAPRELESARVADHGLDPGVFEERLEHLELGCGRQAFPVDDRDDRRSAPPPLPERVEHRAQLAAARRQELAAKPLAKRLHHGQLLEDVGQVVAVCHARGRLCVVLDEAHLIREEAVEPDRRR